MILEQNLIEKVIERASEIQQIPAPTFDEKERAAFVLHMFQQEGLVDTEMDFFGNVYARLPGDGAARPLLVSAHTDTVFPAGTNLSLRREPERIYGPGLGDNSLGVAGLFGLLWALRRARISLPGDLWLVANAGEEGLGDLYGMKAVVERFKELPQAYIILEGMALGQVYHRALASRRFRIAAVTRGGHSWVDYGTPSAVHELAKLASSIAALPVPEKPRSSLNVGTFQGGTSINTIAAEAELELDLRSEDGEILQHLVDQVLALARAAVHPGVNIKVEQVGDRPSGELAQDHPLVQAAVAALRSQGLEARLNIGSTDANVPLSKGYPAVCVGLTNGGGAHTHEEFIEAGKLEKGLAALVELVRRVAG